MVRLVNMYLNETCNSLRLGDHLSDMFPIMNDLKLEGNALSSLLFKFASGYDRRFQEARMA